MVDEVLTKSLYVVLQYWSFFYEYETENVCHIIRNQIQTISFDLRIPKIKGKN